MIFCLAFLYFVDFTFWSLQQNFVANEVFLRDSVRNADICVRERSLITTTIEFWVVVF